MRPQGVACPVRLLDGVGTDLARMLTIYTSRHRAAGEIFLISDGSTFFFAITRGRPS